MTRPGSLEHVRTDPLGCVGWLNTVEYFAPLEVTFVHHDDDVTVFDIDTDPPDGFDGYSAEQGRIVILDDGLAPQAVPLGNEHRRWLHRNPRIAVKDIPTTYRVSLANLIGSLCLWDPKDPPSLRWSWRKGIGEFIAVAQRHLFYEEYWRQEGHWPVEDSPHGAPTTGNRHPLITPATRSAVA